MPNDGGIPRARPSLGKARCEASSDGVFSIAATLLVFDIAVHPPDTPLQQVVDAWPTYLAYLISFLTVGGAWLGYTDQLTSQPPTDRTTNHPSTDRPTSSELLEVLAVCTEPVS